MYCKHRGHNFAAKCDGSDLLCMSKLGNSAAAPYLKSRNHDVIVHEHEKKGICRPRYSTKFKRPSTYALRFSGPPARCINDGKLKSSNRQQTSGGIRSTLGQIFVLILLLCTTADTIALDHSLFCQLTVISMRPAAWPPMAMSKNTTGLAIVAR